MFPFVTPVYAQGQYILKSPLKFTNVFDLIGSFVPYIVIGIGLTLVGFMMYGAFQWLTSTGNPEKLAKAQGTLANAVIGFILFVVMFSLFLFLSSILGVDWGTLLGQL